MDVNRSKRILAVGAPGSGVLDVVKGLTGSKPSLNDTGTTAGLIHEWDINTAYYSAKVSIWIDEIADLTDWKNEFLKPEAQQVIEALGAWVYCFRKPAINGEAQIVEQTLKAIHTIAEEHAGYGADVVMLAVVVPDEKSLTTTSTITSEECEDICSQYGFEFVDFSATGKNEFNENVGEDRMREALEANEWSYVYPCDEDELDIDDLDFTAGDASGFDRDEAEMTAELFGMKAALMGDESIELEADDIVPAVKTQAAQVDDLDRMMSKILAIKESSAELPEAQRKKMAAEVVKQLLQQDSTSKS